MKPGSLGGGGRSFAAFSLSMINVNGSNANGDYSVSSLSSGSFDLTGIGKEDGNSDGTPVTITLTVYPDSVSTAPIVSSR
jgi:hypothetical protein